MGKELTRLPVFRVSEVCLPSCARGPQDVLKVILPDDLLSGMGWAEGDAAIVSLVEEPQQGEMGAIRADGCVYVGILLFGPVGDVYVTRGGFDDRTKHFRPGRYKTIGRVDRFCKSCELRSCVLMQPPVARPSVYERPVFNLKR